MTEKEDETLPRAKDTTSDYYSEKILYILYLIVE